MLENYKTVESNLLSIGRSIGEKIEFCVGKNLITNNVIGFFKLDCNHVFEISYGFFIDHYIYGVTCFNVSSKRVIYKNSKSFHNIEDIKKFIAEITEG